MAAALFLRSSRVVLQHASLAQLTPELTTLDALIHAAQPSRLPAELLWLIRGHVLALVTADLLLASEHTLAAHERILLALLCRDCAAYNTDIYGPNVFRWPWDQFSGPCACRSKDKREYAARVAMFRLCVDSLQSSAWIQARTDDDDEVITPGSLQFTRRFLDANHVLEYHLSRQARRLARLAYKAELHYTGAKSVSARTRSFVKVRSIWDVVELVLQQYDCEALLKGAKPAPEDGQASDDICHDSIVEVSPHPSSESPLADIDPSSPTTPRPASAASPGGTQPSQQASPFWTLLSPDNEQDRIYISPQGQSVRGFQNIPRSSSAASLHLQGTPSSALSSEDKTYPWASRARLIHTKRDLGLDLDYSQFCATLHHLPPGNQLDRDLAAQAARQSNSSAEATTTFSPVPTSSNSPSPSTPSTSISTGSALSMALALIRNRSTSGCYRSSRPLPSFPSAALHFSSASSFYGSGACLHHTLSADPRSALVGSAATTMHMPPSSLALSPNRLLNTLLHFFLATASVLGYSMYLTGFLLTLALSIPLAVVKLALTVVCFYSRPSSFRLV